MVRCISILIRHVCAKCRTSRSSTRWMLHRHALLHRRHSGNSGDNHSGLFTLPCPEFLFAGYMEGADRQDSKHHGLISVIVHPDYLQTEEARNAYKGLLGCLSDLRASTGMWITLPGEVDRWWRQRSKMQLVRDGSRWRIEGAGSERASIAYATLENGSLHYRIE